MEVPLEPALLEVISMCHLSSKNIQTWQKTVVVDLEL